MEQESKPDHVTLDVPNITAQDIIQMQEELARLQRDNAEKKIETDRRKPMKLFCPTCKVDVKTEIMREMNEKIESELRVQYAVGIIFTGLIAGRGICHHH